MFYIKRSTSYLSYFHKLFLLFLIGNAYPLHSETKNITIPLFDNLGSHHYPISTNNPQAQQYFDQGLILTFAFNHAEAIRSFQASQQLDPTCSMCFWGEALAMGPNINAPMDPDLTPKAKSLVQLSLALAGKVQPREKALIQALSNRYATRVTDDRSLFDIAYASSMRDVAKQFPDDAVIASLFAEALMDLHPWDFWSKQGVAQPWTAEIVSVLEHALKLDKNNPLANHLYVHVLEASPMLEKAIPSAERLPQLVPGSGHLVHMPAHIYIRVGRYRDAILANQNAAKIDQTYLRHNHAEGIYTLAYVPHNYHFLWAAAIKTGQQALAAEAAEDTANHVNKKMLREPGLSGTLQHFFSIPLYTKVLFGDWDKILSEPAPSDDLIYHKGIWHYARGLAMLRKNNTEQAQTELQLLKQNLANPKISDLSVFDINPVSQLLQIAVHILQAELALHSKDFNTAIKQAEQAVALEDELNYNEPKDWYLPPRQVLGAIFLEAGRAKKAEQVYRQDLVYHPQNGWSLFGLMQSLRKQGKYIEANQVQKQFDEVWSDADVTLNSSRF